MASPRQIRRLAFQLLYELDAHGQSDPEAALAAACEGEKDHHGEPTMTPAERDEAMDLATDAYANRARADRDFAELAPAWPAHRQPAVDRAILRLAHHEMTSGRTHPKIAVNEAVELAKAYSTDRSPAFINGLLDKILKRVLGGAPVHGGDRTVEQGEC